LDKSNHTIILPVGYFAPVSYFAMRKQYDCVLQVHENYQKRTIRNRAVISSANGPVTLSVPLMKGKTKLPISKVQISYHEAWHRNHLKTIRSAYATSPYFEFYYDKIEDVLSTKPQGLLELYDAIDKICCNILDIEMMKHTAAFRQENVSNIDIAHDSKVYSVEESGYEQVFGSKFPFLPDLSIMDLFFNLGPESITYLKNLKLTFS